MEVAQVIVWILYAVSVFFFYRAVFKTHAIVKSLHKHLLGSVCPCAVNKMKEEEMKMPMEMPVMKDGMPMDKM